MCCAGGLPPPEVKECVVIKWSDIVLFIFLLNIFPSCIYIYISTYLHDQHALERLFFLQNSVLCWWAASSWTERMCCNKVIGHSVIHISFFKHLSFLYIYINIYLPAWPARLRASSSPRGVCCSGALPPPEQKECVVIKWSDIVLFIFLF